MTFLVQFKRLRRGVPEVIRTLHLETVDSSAALARVQSLAGTHHWPLGTDALRVMDDGGRTLCDWTVPAAFPQPSPNTRLSAKSAVFGASEMLETGITRADKLPAPHVFAVGQPVSYAEDGQPDTWEGGYEIIRLEELIDEPQYVIRSADQSYNRIVHEHELREDLGARVRGI
jgi:hypothetical protein